MLVGDPDVCPEFLLETVHPPEGPVELVFVLGRTDVIVDQAAHLVFELLDGDLAVSLGKLGITIPDDLQDLLLIQRHVRQRAGVFRGVLRRDLAKGERAAQMGPGHQGDVARRIQAGHRALALLVDADARKAMPAAKVAVRGPELDLAGAEVDTAPLEEPLLHRSFGGEQQVFHFADLLFAHVTHVDAHGTALGKVLHVHEVDAGMVFLELLGKGVEQVCAAGQGDVQEGRVDVLDDVIDQRVFEAGKLRTGTVGHDVAVTGIAREVIDAVQIAVGRQTETGRAAGTEDDAFGLADHDLSRTDVDAHSAADPVAVLQKTYGHDAVVDLGAVLIGFFGQYRLELRLLHGDAELALGVDLQLVELPFFIHGEADPPVHELFHDGPGPFGHGIVDGLVHDALAGFPVGLHIQLGGLFGPGYSHDVHGIHAAGDAPGILHVSFFKHDDPLPGVHLFGPYSRHHAGATAADNQHICTQGHVWLHTSSPFLPHLYSS